MTKLIYIFVISLYWILLYTFLFFIKKVPLSHACIYIFNQQTYIPFIIVIIIIIFITITFIIIFIIIIF